jgi:hypothetical protein
MLLTKELE